MVMSKNLAHMVYFKLKDTSKSASDKLVADCLKYLKPHEGIIYFSAGILARELKRDVNDHNFDVALHVVFKDLAAHDAYQESAPHNEFIAQNKENWEKVRVFDSHV